MCEFISFFHNPNTGDIRVWNLQSHGETEEHLKLDEHWCEGHYTPDDKVEARVETDRHDPVILAENIKHRWPTFTKFWTWCMKQDVKPLEEILDLYGTNVSNLTPLKGIPLKRLDLDGTNVSDLTPLKGMLLKELDLDGTNISDLTPLKGMPLTDLDITNTPAAKKPLPKWLKDVNVYQ